MRPVADRLVTVALLSSSSGPRDLRIDGWRVTFAALHDLLGDEAFDEEAWSVLAPALPSAPDWDRCLRLRRGAIAEIRRDKLSPHDAAAIIEGAGQFQNEMLDEIKPPAAKKKSKHWLRELVDLILP